MAEHTISKIKLPNGDICNIKDTNTWRGIQDNLTSSTNTTESLSAKQGYLLANGSARDNTKVSKSGDRMTGDLIIGETSSDGTVISSGSFKIGAKNDNYGVMPFTNNWNSLGASNLYWYRSYVTNYYGTTSHIVNWDSNSNIGTPVSSSAASVKGLVNFYNKCVAGGTQTRTTLAANDSATSNITIALPSSAGTLALTTSDITGNAATASSVALSGVTGADDLKAIEALSGTSGFLKKTAANTWTLDTNTYLTSSTGVTSIAGKTGTVTLADLGLSQALRFIGITSTGLSDGDTTSTLEAKSSGSLIKTTGFVTGDVVIDTNSAYEYVWTGSAWERLGGDSSYKTTQTAFTNSKGSADGTNTSTSFIYSFSQTPNGDIQDIKTRALPTASTSVAGIIKIGTTANDACAGNDSRLSNARTPTSHTHGNIQNGGTLQTNDVTIGNGDKLVITDSSDSNKIARVSIAFDGSTTTKALTPKGTWETFNNYIHPTGDGYLHVPATGTNNNGKFLQAGSSAGSISWASLPTASPTTAGITTVGASGGAAAYSHTHPYLTNTNTGASDRPIYITGNAPAQTTYRMSGTNTTATTAMAITTDLPTGNWYVNGTADIYSQSDGVVYAEQYNSAWIHEIYGDYRTGQIAVRGKNNGTWQAWRKILDSSNWKTLIGATTASSSATKFLREDGSWQVPVDTKNTAGSTNSTSKLYLIGAGSQAIYPTTNSYQFTYTNNGLLSALKLGLNLNGTEKVHLEWNNTDQSIDFIFN